MIVDGPLLMSSSRSAWQFATNRLIRLNLRNQYVGPISRSTHSRRQFRTFTAAAREHASPSEKQRRRHLAHRRRPRGQDDLLYVRLSLRHRRSRSRRQDTLYQRKQGPSGQSRCVVRQGQLRDHAALQPSAAEKAVAAHCAARLLGLSLEHRK